MNDEQLALWGTKKELMARVQAWLKDPDHLEPPIEAIGERFYLWQDAEFCFFAKHMNRDMISCMMKGEGLITAYWGSFKKHFVTPYGQVMRLTPTVNARTPCKNPWWNNCSRIYLPGASGVEDLSYPKGYEISKEVRYQDSLLREQ